MVCSGSAAVYFHYLAINFFTFITWLYVYKGTLVYQNHNFFFKFKTASKNVFEKLSWHVLIYPL